MLATANKLMIAFTLVVFVAQMVYWYGRLPDPLPSHFDAQGQVDGEMSKNGFYVLMGLMNTFFLIGFPLLGKLLGRVPNSMINMPNKEYWLAPERRDKTIAKNCVLLTAIGWMTGWLFIGIIQLTALVAVKARDSISPEFTWLMAIYLIGITAAVVFLIASFRVSKSAVSNTAGNPQTQ